MINEVENVMFFIKQKCKSKQEITNSAHLTQFAPEALQLISSGELIWAPSPTPTLLHFRKLFSQRYLPIPSQTQMTERGVKEGKICATASRSEQSRSAFAVARSGVVEKSGDRAEEIKKSMSKPNK